jgi:Winged helix DNA-binding domain
VSDLTWRQALAWRMERHGLSGAPRFATAADVATALCGLHAQVMSSAELTAFVRGASVSREGLLKTWAVRGTLHLLPIADLGMWQSALSTFDHFLKGAWVRAFGFETADQVEELIAEVGAALDGGSLTREELAAALPHHGDKLRESWGSALKPAAFRGLLAFDEPTGQTVRFMRPPKVKRPPVDDAVRAVTRRYLGAYAPARREDLARWWGTHALSPAKAQKRIEALGDEAVQVDVEGERCWVLAQDLDAMRAAKPSGAARLVPLFDQYVVNSNRGIEAIVPEAARPLVFRQAGWISAALIVDGAVAGVWRHERRGGRVEIAIEPFAPVRKKVRAQADADAARLADHLGLVPEITWK